MGKQNKQEIHYVSLSRIGGWKKRDGKKKKELTLLYHSQVLERKQHSPSLAQRAALDRVSGCQPERLWKTVPLFCSDS